MSPAGCEEASLHPVPAGLIHSGHLTALTPTATLTPRARSTAALAPGSGHCPELAPGGSCTVHAPQGSRLSRPHAGRRRGPPPGPPERSHLRRRRSRLLPRRSERRPRSAASPGRPGSRPRSRLQNTGPAAGAAMETRRFRFRRARTLLTARARTGSQCAGAVATAEAAQAVLPGLCLSVSFLGHRVAPDRELEGGRHGLQS